VVQVLEAPKPPEVKWRLVAEKTYPDAWFYIGKCTHEDYGFLVDPITLFGLFVTARSVEDWAKTDLVAKIEEEYKRQGSKPLMLRVYVGEEPVLWGLIKYPAVRVESYHASPGLTLILWIVLAAIIAIIVIFLFKIATEAPWFGLGLLLIGGGIVLFLIAREVRARG
jgi:hypothetical protein